MIPQFVFWIIVALVANLLFYHSFRIHKPTYLLTLHLIIIVSISTYIVYLLSDYGEGFLWNFLTVFVFLLLISPLTYLLSSNIYSLYIE